MKTYTLELTATELGVLAAICEVMRANIESSAGRPDVEYQRREMTPLFEKIRVASERMYYEDNDTSQQS